MVMNFRFQVFQILEDGRENCWRSSRTFDGAMKEARFSRVDIEYARRKGFQLDPHYIRDTKTGEIWTVNP